MSLFCPTQVLTFWFEFAAFIKADVDRNADLLKAADFKPE